MIDFLAANMAEIGTLLVALVIIVWALVTKQWVLVRSTALSFMLAAEKLLKTEQGKEKMQWVFMLTWDNLPAWFKKLVPENKLREKLQEWYDMTKGMLI